MLSDGERVYTTTTDPSGQFRIKVPAKSYNVTVEAQASASPQRSRSKRLFAPKHRHASKNNRRASENLPKTAGTNLACLAAHYEKKEAGRDRRMQNPSGGNLTTPRSR